MKSQDAFRRLYILATAAVLVLMQTGMAVCVLYRIYNVQFRTQLYFRGHVLMAMIYAVILIFVGRVFGGLLIGVRKNSEVVFSHVFTLFTANIAWYVLMVLQSLKFPNPGPLFLMTILQIAAASLLIFVMGRRYRILFRPYDVLLLYEGESIGDFHGKLKARGDQFHVREMLSAAGDPELIKKKIDENRTVILWDIPAEKRNKIFKYCYENSKRIYVMPKISDIILNGASAVHLFDTPLLLTDGNPLEYEERVIKRFFDIVLSALLILLLSPLMCVTAVCIRLSDGGPVLYSQVRCTKNGKQFKILKFRSMVVNAEAISGAQLAKENDPRITKVGRVIRKLRIDELPQLFNVLAGDMSFVGPRPERPEFIEKYMEDMPEFSYRMKVRAGITGYAQLYGKYNTRPYDKLKFDLYYMEQYSLLLDIKLMILTIKIIFTKESTEGVKEDVTASGVHHNTGT